MGDAKRDARAAAGLRPRCCQIARRGPQDHAVAWLWAGQTPPLEDCRAQPAGLSRRRLTADLAVGRTTLSPLESAPPALIEVRFAADSPLEGAGFEPSVPRQGGRLFRLR